MKRGSGHRSRRSRAAWAASLLLALGWASATPASGLELPGPLASVTPLASLASALPQLPAPSVALPLPTPSIKLPLPTSTIRLPLPSVTLPVPLPTLPVPLPTLPLPSLPLPTPSLRLPTPTLPVTTPTLPLPTPTSRVPTPTVPLGGPTATAGRTEASPLTGPAQATELPGGFIGLPDQSGALPRQGVSGVTGPREPLVDGVPSFVVPAMVVGIPTLLVLLVLAAQGALGLAWLPVARRFVGSFGFRRREG